MTSKRTSTKRSAVARRPSVNLPWLRRQGAVLVGQLRTRLDKEGRKAYREMETRVADLQKRLGRETTTLGRRVDDAVRGTLARLDIPSRREIAELTRKVDELSHKIDGFRARSRRKAARA
jgi:poly(hydroxyalkanoate) granule-associated protein